MKKYKGILGWSILSAFTLLTIIGTIINTIKDPHYLIGLLFIYIIVGIVIILLIWCFDLNKKQDKS